MGLAMRKPLNTSQKDPMELDSALPTAAFGATSCASTPAHCNTAQVTS